MIIYLSLLICIIGLLVYVLATNPKTVELGRIAFAFGLLAFLLRLSGDAVKLLNG
jgi:Na+/phosphate symporter